MNLSALAFLIDSNLNAQEQERLFEILYRDADLFGKLFPGAPLISHIKKEKAWNHPLAQAYDTWFAKRS